LTDVCNDITPILGRSAGYRKNDLIKSHEKFTLDSKTCFLKNFNATNKGGISTIRHCIAADVKKEISFPLAQVMKKQL